MRPNGLARLRKNLDRSAFTTLGHIERFTDHGAVLLEVFSSDDGTILAPVELATGFVSVLSDGTVLETRQHVPLAGLTASLSNQPRRGYLLEVVDGGFAERLAHHRRRVSEAFTARGVPRRFAFIDDAQRVLEWVKRAVTLPVVLTMLALLLGGLGATALFAVGVGAGLSQAGFAAGAGLLVLSVVLFVTLSRGLAPRLRFADRRV